jgi:hypothetical protein
MIIIIIIIIIIITMIIIPIIKSHITVRLQFIQSENYSHTLAIVVVTFAAKAAVTIITWSFCSRIHSKSHTQLHTFTVIPSHIIVSDIHSQSSQSHHSQ